MLRIEEQDLNPEVMDVLGASYGVYIGDMYVGGYYKLAGADEYTPARLGADSYLSPGPCIVEVLKSVLATHPMHVEVAINKAMLGV